MKKTRRALLISLILVFAFYIIINNKKSDIKLIADSGKAQETKSLETGSYQKYIDDNTLYHQNNYSGKPLLPILSNPILILGESYASTSSSDLTSEKKQMVEKVAITSPDDVYSKSVSANKGATNVAIHRGGTIDYTINVTEAGFYNLYLDYYTITGYSSNIERKLLINGVVPFSNCENVSFSRVWRDDQIKQVKDGKEIIYNVLETTSNSNSILINKTWRNDTNGNELKPQQVEIQNSKCGSYIKDAMGYVTLPFEFYFKEGSNTISFSYTKEPVIIDAIELRSVTKTDSYATYLEALKAKHGEISLTNTYTRIEAEATARKSSPTLYPITDRSDSATTPFSITKTLLNSVGGTNWKVLGDWIAWDFTVPADGYYEISMRAKQNLVRGMFSSRSVSIAKEQEDGTMGEYEILFEELNNLQISYKNKWKNITLGNSDDNYLFYFEKDAKYSIKMEVTLGDYAPLIARLQNVIDDLNAMYRRIIAYTTTSPDPNRDYELTKRFADLFYGLDEEGNYTVSKKGEFYLYLEELTAISNTIKEISGGASDKTGVIDSVVVILQKFVDKPRTITKRLSTFSTNVSSLGSLLNELREAPLNIDYIEIHTPDVKLSKPNAGFFKSLWDGIASFFASFFIDYSSINKTTEEDTKEKVNIEVWMTLGRDQANVIRNLIDTSFSNENGPGKDINVDLKLTGADVLLKATLAGIGPDVALNVDSSLPVNYGLRNAVLDLTEFDDFWDTIYAIPDGQLNYDESFENVYMASSIRQFQFSSKEVKDEYFDSSNPANRSNLEGIDGIYALPEKQIFLMMFVRDDVMQELNLAPSDPSEWDNMTWDDMIDLVTSLQARQLQFYLPVNDSGATALNPIFVSMLYQNSGRLYINNNMESGLKTEEAMKTFEYWTDLYTNYAFPTSASFVNRFRTGEMPIGISYYELYNTLSVFAPELKGKWSFHLIPGTRKVDSLGNTYIDHTATASGSAGVILKEPALKNEKTKNASWTFLKWWTSAKTQSQFGREMEGILGSAARHTTANVIALKELAWPAEDLDMLLKQWSTVHEMPQIAGSYIVGREVENAYRKVINKFSNARETLYEYSQIIDREINRKRSEFNLPLLND